MTKKKKVTVAEQLLNNKPVNQLNLFIQFVVLIALLFATICSVFVKEFSAVVKILVSLVFILMAYNNYTIFKKKGFTVLYSVAALYFLVMTILEIYGA